MHSPILQNYTLSGVYLDILELVNRGDVLYRQARVHLKNEVTGNLILMKAVFVVSGLHKFRLLLFEYLVWFTNSLSEKIGSIAGALLMFYSHFSLAEVIVLSCEVKEK